MGKLALVVERVMVSRLLLAALVRLHRSAPLANVMTLVRLRGMVSTKVSVAPLFTII